MSERSIPYPEVRIRNGWLLTSHVSPHLPSHSSQYKNATPVPSNENVERVVADYKDAWGPRKDLIVPGMCRILDLSFRHNIIDVHIAPGFDAISQPVIIGTGYHPDHFVDILTHELMHTLLVDNTRYGEDAALLSHWRSIFGADHSDQALIHIPVHAGLEAIYRDVLDEPYRLARDQASCAVRPGYRQAWDFVQKVGYETITNQLVTTHHILAEDPGLPEGPPPT